MRSVRDRRSGAEHRMPEQTTRHRVRHDAGRPLSDHESHEAGLLDGLDDSVFDSYLLERATLERGLCSTRLSPHMFVAGPAPDRGCELGFLHSAATTTSKVSRDLIADKQFRRAVLNEAGFRTRRANAAHTYRAMITRERPVSVLLETGPDLRDVVDEAHADLAGTLTQVLAAFPGLAHAEIVFAMDDHAQSPSAQPFSITGMSVRPRLAPYEYSEGAHSGVVARRILDAVAPAITRTVADVFIAEVVIAATDARDQRRRVEQIIADVGLRLVEPVAEDRAKLTAVIDGAPCCAAASVAVAMSVLPCDRTQVRPRVAAGEGHEVGAHV